MNTPKEILEKIFALISQDAANRRSDAGYGGRWDDGGAAVLEAQVRFYKLGLEQRLPDEWETYFRQAINEADPEYAQYLRLKGKFG